MLTGKRILTAGYGNIKGKGILRAGHGSKTIFNSTPSLNKHWNTKCCQNESRFNGVYSRDNLSGSIKNGAYVINLDEYADI